MSTSSAAGPQLQSVLTINGRAMAGGDAEAHVSARDRGLTLADGLFETMRVHGGRVFQLEQHMERLERSLAALRIPVVPEIRTWVADAVRAFAAQDAAVRLTVTRGVGPGGLAPPPRPSPTVLVLVSPLPPFPPALYSAGLQAVIVAGRRNAKSATAGMKTLSYTEAVAGFIEAHERGADEALFLDTDDHLSEASASNLFFVANGVLVTPPLSCGPLPGITRATVLTLAAALGVATDERASGPADLFAATEAFLTSSLRGLAPLVRVDGRSIGDGTPGPLTARLSAAHAGLMARECGTAGP